MKHVNLKRLLLAVFIISMSAGTTAFAKGENSQRLEGVCNINEAPLAKLMLLPYVGRTRAEAIIQYRRTHPFRQARDITRVKGIGLNTFEKLKNHITTTGPTTIRRTPPTRRSSKRPSPSK